VFCDGSDGQRPEWSQNRQNSVFPRVAGVLFIFRAFRSILKQTGKATYFPQLIQLQYFASQLAKPMLSVQIFDG